MSGSRGALRRFGVAATKQLREGKTPGGIAWTRVTAKVADPAARPLLMLHGYACGQNDWGALPRMLAAKARRDVLVLDNRGVGESEAAERVYTVAEMADDALAVLDAAGVEQAAVMGISMGGLIAQSLALAHPDRVYALVLGCTSHGGREATPSPPEFLSLCAALAEGMRGQLAALMRFNSTAQLGSIGCPTLVVTGERDRAIMPVNSDSLARRIPGARLLCREGAGHFWWALRTADAVDEIAAFMRASEGEGGGGGGGRR